MPSAALARVLLAVSAMRTRFELLLEGDDPVRLRAAGEEALAEIERLDARLSRYRPASAIWALNAGAAERPVRVAGDILALLRACGEVTAETDGAFDASVGALVDAWRRAGAEGRRPTADELTAARAASGWAHVVLDEAAGTVRFLRPGVSIDLGGAGKGYAIDRAIECLVDAGVEHALLHGGTSSVHAIGPQADGQPWPVAWAPDPAKPAERESFHLIDSALSISATHGRTFTVDGRIYGHVFDPRTGEPVPGPRAASVLGPSSFLCDMQSTARLVLGDNRRAPAYAQV